MVFKLSEKDLDKIQRRKKAQSKYYQEHKEACKERIRNYRKKNPEKVREWQREWRKKNPEKVREYIKKWRDSHKEQIKEYEKKTREQRLKWRKKRRENRRNELLNLIGRKCYLCGSNDTKRLLFHEIHGRKHETHCRNKTYHYITSHKNDFVTLCKPCHVNLHKVARFMNIKKLIDLLILLNEG